MSPPGAGTATLPIVPWLFLPLRTPRGGVGVLGVAQEERLPALDSEARVLLETLAEQTAAALERGALARDMVSTRSAAETERVRNTLLASISHDFRTPLASILGSATSVLDYGDKLDEAGRNDLLTQIKEEAENLDEMVRNLLAITRIDAGGLELRWDWLDLREVVDRIVSAARRRGALQKIESSLPADLPLVRADASLIEQAIGNIIGNAIVHTPKETKIVIDAVVTPQSVAVRVTDDGPGIPADALPRVFEKFVRATARLEPFGRRRRRRPGPCNCEGDHRSPWRLDRCREPRRRRPRHPHHIGLFADGDAVMTGKTRVLLVDDEAAILRFLRPTLEANNYELVAAGTVAEALKRAAADAPDIVVLDLGLPDGDGKDVIRRVREWSDIPIIVLSARDRETEKIEALDLGADDFVNKPFGVGELLARMRTALRHRMQRNAETPVLKLGTLEVDNVRHWVRRGGQDIKLTPKEFELLSFLARHAGKVLTHRQILTAVWGPAHTEDTQYLRVYIGHLRQKIEDKPDDPQIIVTEPGVGYRILEPV